MFQRILTVCMGNICRSPMAAGVLAHEGEGSVTVESAGISALVGEPADPAAVDLMAERGIDIAGHRGRQLTAKMLMEFDLVLTMEQRHVKIIESMWAGARGRVHRLGKWDAFDVPDPYGGPRGAFVEALTLIDQGVAAWKGRIWN